MFGGQYLFGVSIRSVFDALMSSDVWYYITALDRKSPNASNWANAIATSIAAIITAVALIFAFFQDHLRRVLFKPKLNAELKQNETCYVRISKRVVEYGEEKVLDSIHARILIKNNGNVSAEKVEVYLGAVYEWDVKRYSLMSVVLPMNFVWSHVGGIYCENMSPKFSKLCDFGYVLDYLPIRFSISSIMPPENSSHDLKPGEYLFELFVASSNTLKPKKVYLKVHIGDVYDIINIQNTIRITLVSGIDKIWWRITGIFPSYGRTLVQ
jgi:hypothetical protein